MFGAAVFCGRGGVVDAPRVPSSGQAVEAAVLCGFKAVVDGSQCLTCGAVPALQSCRWLYSRGGMYHIALPGKGRQLRSVGGSGTLWP